MASKTIEATKSSWLGGNNTQNLHYGAGADPHFVVGNFVALGDENDFRGLVQFPLTSAVWSDVARITQAQLQLTTAASCATAGLSQGASPSVEIRRNTASWSANSGTEGSPNTNATKHPGPSQTSAEAVFGSTPSTDPTATTLDVTAIVRRWAPTSVEGGANAANYGFVLRYHTTGTSKVAVFRTHLDGTSSRRPKLIITYETTIGPKVPTPTAPIGPLANANSFKVSYSITDALTALDLQVTTDATFAAITHWNRSGAPSVSIAYAGTALSPGVTYYWRTRATNAIGTSAWSASVSFTADPDQLPADAWTLWATTILAHLYAGVGVTGLGTLIPEDEQVAQLATADYRDVVHVVDSYHGDPIDRYVEIVGVAVHVDQATGWTVELVTEDVTA